MSGGTHIRGSTGFELTGAGIEPLPLAPIAVTLTATITGRLHKTTRNLLVTL